LITLNADAEALEHRSTTVGDWSVDDYAQPILVSAVEKAAFKQLRQRGSALGNLVCAR
jgi:hypothetical protein